MQIDHKFRFATVTRRPLSCWELLTLAQCQPPENPRHVQALVKRTNNLQCQSVTTDKKEHTKDKTRMRMTRENNLEGENHHVIA
jgi:hypothetical protein